MLGLRFSACLCLFHYRIFQELQATSRENRVSSKTVGRLQNLLELLLLVESQSCRELDTVLNNEVAPLSSLLGDGHA